jgi:hypothetical protein
VHADTPFASAAAAPAGALQCAAGERVTGVADAGAGGAPALVCRTPRRSTDSGGAMSRQHTADSDAPARAHSGASGGSAAAVTPTALLHGAHLADRVIVARGGSLSPPGLGTPISSCIPAPFGAVPCAAAARGSEDLEWQQHGAAAGLLLRARADVSVLRDLKIGPLLGQGCYGRVHKGATARTHGWGLVTNSSCRGSVELSPPVAARMLCCPAGVCQAAGRPPLWL